MITRLREWFDLHRTAKSRLARQGASIEYWMNEAMKLERQYEDVQPAFLVYPEGAVLIPNDASYLGEFPPLVPCEDCDDYIHEGPGL